MRLKLLNKFAFFCRKIFSTFIKLKSVQVNGHTIYLDKTDSLELSFSTNYEEDEVNVVRNFVKSGNVVVDVGALIGYYTLIFAKTVGKKGKIFSFEPHPQNYELLKKNVQVNDYQNVIVEQMAVTNFSGTAKLYMSKHYNFDHRIYNFEDRKSIEVTATKLDDYFRGFNRDINFVKLDIQGVEKEAIEGMSKILQKYNDIKIITEFAPSWLNSNGVDAEDFLKLLLQYDFKLYDIKDELIPINIQTLLKKYTCKEKNYTNLFCMRQ